MLLSRGLIAGIFLGSTLVPALTYAADALPNARIKYKTPEECFSAFASAKEKDDLATELNCCSTAIQNQIVGMAAFELQRAAFIFRAHKKEIADLYEKHDLADVNVMEMLQLNEQQGLHMTGERIEDKRAFLVAARKLLAKVAQEEGVGEAPPVKPRDPKTPAPKVKLVDVKKTDDTATGQIEVDAGKGPQPGGSAFFRLVDGGWVLGLPRELPPAPKFSKAQREALANWEFGDAQYIWSLQFDEKTPANGLVSIRCVQHGATDKDLTGIELFSTLRDADLASSALTDEGLALLKPHSRLAFLSLADTQVSDKAIPIIVGFKELVALDLRSTTLTPAGVEQIKRALPKCEVLTGLSFHFSGDPPEVRQEMVGQQEVVVFVYLRDGDKMHEKFRREVLNSFEVVQLIKSNGVEVVGIDADDEQEQVLRIEIFKARSKVAEKMSGDITREKLLAALRTAGKSLPRPPPPKKKPKQPHDDPEVIAQLDKLGFNYHWDDDGHITHVNLGVSRHREDPERKTTDDELGFLSRLKWLETLDLRDTAITGRGLNEIGKLANISTVFADNSALGDEGLAYIAKLPQIASLVLPRCRITDKGLRYFSNCKTLRDVGVDSVPISDFGLAGLENCDQIQSLGLAGTKVTGMGLAHLRKMQALSRLDLSGTTVGDDALPHWTKLQELEALNLSRTKIGDKSLGELDKLSKLANLNVAETRVTNAGLKSLAGTTTLIDLDLEDTTVNDDGLAALKGLTNLLRLNVVGTKVSPVGLRKFKASLPNLEITYGPHRADKRDFGDVERIRRDDK